MVIDERARHELYQRLEQTLGEEATNPHGIPAPGWLG